MFLHNCYFYRFRASRLESERLILESAIAGLIFAALGRWSVVALYGTQCGAWLKMQLQAFAPFEYTGTGIATVLLALSVSWLINAICEVFDGSRSIRLFVAANLDDALVLLFQEAINTESPLLVTLATRKVYVGYISEALYRKSKDPFFSLALLLSGYRDEGTLEFRESINYIEHGDLGDFEITIPMSQVVSAHLFNIDRYNAVFGRKLVLPSSN